jgi:serine/threonine protein kinase
VLSRRVAVKVLRDDLAVDDATRARFRNEAIAAARVNHPNIVATYDTGDDDGTAYIVMEFVDGPTVRRLLDERGALPVNDVIRIGTQVAAALEAAHRAGLVHRDVKPPNVLVPPNGPVKVTDFGIAKATGSDDLTKTGTVMGTARYLAPEQVSGEPTDARTDVYGLGLLLFEMLCGTPPFGGDTDVATAMARLTTSAPPIRAQRPDVPAPLDDLVHRCLARDRSRRFGSAGEVRAALAAVPAGPSGAHVVRRAPPHGPRPVKAPPPPPPPRRSSALTWVWVAIIFVLAAAAGITAFFVLRDSGGSDHNSDAPAIVHEVDHGGLALA